ncbi:hypothetical protein BDZ45DRAFT_774866 [Acephala macrosclerotiorum]|nr:hypothetical protein BDZ45DRAFT_774866 [Acephala macrosclerotiorum]
MAKVCANITGLSKAMRRDGSLENPDDLKDFTLGFTQGKSSFDFIDIGYGKEMAGSKIKAHAHALFFTPFSTWASVTSIASSPLMASPVSVKNGTTITINRKPILTPALAKPAWWVFGSRGLDPPITVNATVLDKIKRRTINNKPCYNYYLRGSCAKEDECCFEHRYKAIEEDLKAITYLTRSNLCLNGQDCELDSCIYGYYCPSVILGTNGKESVCNAFGCSLEKKIIRLGPSSSIRGKSYPHNTRPSAANSIRSQGDPFDAVPLARAGSNSRSTMHEPMTPPPC